MRLQLLIISISLLSLAICGCGGKNTGSSGGELEAVEIEATPAEPASEIADFKFHTLVANIPSPLVTYDILKAANAPYIKDLSNPLGNRSKYQLESSKAMNFGVYMADFGHALLNDDNQKALRYYAAAYDLAKGLGFDAVLDKVVNERLIANVGNTDSAKVIINEVYEALDTYLESNDQLKTAGYIISGGWAETQHIVLYLVKDTQSESLLEHLRNEVYKQQLHIGNLISFLTEYGSDSDVNALIEQLATVKEAYDLLIDAGDVTGDKMDGLVSAISKFRSNIID